MSAYRYTFVIGGAFALLATTACRTDQEERFIDTCIQACETPAEQGCPGRGANDTAFCEEECEHDCDQTPEDCLDEAIAYNRCRALSDDVCAVPWTDCDEESSRLLLCAAFESSVLGFLD